MPRESTEKVENYKKLLLEAKPERCEGVFSRTADNFEDALLEFNDFPTEYFDFALSLLREERFYSRPVYGIFCSS